MKAEKEETTCLLGIAGNVKASVHVLVKRKKGSFSSSRTSNEGKEKLSAGGDSWEMEKTKGKSAKSNITLILLNTP